MTPARFSSGSESRIVFFDTWRGLSIISMVLFHFAYDLVYIEGLALLWFTRPLTDLWGASISWSFLFIAGSMCSFSKNALKRAFIYGLFALMIYVATSIAHIDAPISFGIIYCMAACTLIEALLQKCGIFVQGYTTAALLFILFLVLYNLPSGTVGIGPLCIRLPSTLYATGYLAWLGFPGLHFIASDYYPLLPYLLLYLSGAACNRAALAQGYTPALQRLYIPVVSEIGKYPLVIYILHQPLLLLIAGVLTGHMPI